MTEEKEISSRTPSPQPEVGEPLVVSFPNGVSDVDVGAFKNRLDEWLESKDSKTFVIPSDKTEQLEEISSTYKNEEEK